MIAIRPFSGAFRNVGRNALDLPVAALSGLAVVFIAFAMPASVLSDAVGASGLPSILPAAAPPLGLTARTAIGIGGALAVFGLVFVLLRLLDRSGLDRKSRAEQEAEEAPRRRRRDFHPDASVRRPISAARDLGEPQSDEDRTQGATPLWLAGPEPAEAAPVEQAQEAELEVEEQPEPEVEAQSEPVFEQEAAPEAVLPPEPEAVDQPVASEPASLPELMDRLERGLARLQQPPAPAVPAPPAIPAATAAPQVFPEARDDRLQSAIDSLQRLAARTS